MKAPVIVIVEDDPQLQSVLSRILLAEGIEVTSFGSGEAALEHFLSGAGVDLVLLDVGLPGIDGLEVCRWLKHRPETRLLPVIILTGHGDAEHRLLGIEAGADDFLSKPFDRSELVARVRSLLRLKSYTDQLEDAAAVLLVLGRSIESRDPYTGGHCERLSTVSVALARRLGLDEDDQAALRTAGVLHDLGKVAIPDAILLKPGPLTEAERRVMEQHPVIGDEICAPIRSFASVRPIIRHHHERYNGSGYPDGLAGDAIPHTARVLQVVDVFDALITERPYKIAFPVAQAVEMLKAEVAQGWWDPQAVAAMLELEASGELKASLDAAFASGG